MKKLIILALAALSATYASAKTECKCVNYPTSLKACKTLCKGSQEYEWKEKA